MKDALGHGSDERGGAQDVTHQDGVRKIGNLVSPEALAAIQQNPGGFSVTPSGKQPTGGYMVSLPGRTSFVQTSDLAGPRGKQILEEYASRNRDVLSQRGGHIGGWTDTATNKTHLDVSQNVSRRSHAVRAGTERNQISIWDVKRKREIKTGGTGG